MFSHWVIASYWTSWTSRDTFGPQKCSREKDYADKFYNGYVDSFSEEILILNIFPI